VNSVGAVCENVNEWVGISDIPLLREEGGRDIKTNGAKPPYLERTGWSIYQNVSESGFPSSLTTPSARNKDASRNFHDRASTPPHEEGNVPRWVTRLREEGGCDIKKKGAKTPH